VLSKCILLTPLSLIFRIANGQFSLNNKSYTLPINNGPNSLHGGLRGFDKRDFTYTFPQPDTLLFKYRSEAGEEGYPMSVDVEVEFKVTEKLELGIQYRVQGVADSDSDSDDSEPGSSNEPKETVVNLTNHSYFNLSGFKIPTIHTHVLSIPNALGHMELNEHQIPTGRLVKVGEDGYEAFDFTGKSEGKELGKELGDAKVMEFRGYDHYYVIREALKEGGQEKEMKVAAVVECKEVGVKMVMETDAMGFQIYTANWSDGTIPTKKTQPQG
jgi:aldose 1-epimerase